MSDLVVISDGEDDETPPFPSKRARKNSTPTVLNIYTESSTQKQPPGSASTPFLIDELPLSNDVTVNCSFGSGARVSSGRENKFSGKRVISLESDSEDSPRPETSKKYEPIHHADYLEQRCGLETASSDTDFDNSTNWMHRANSPYSLPNDAIEVDSDQEKEEKSAENMGRYKQSIGSKCTSLYADALPKKQMSREEKNRALEEKKLRKEQEKLQKAAVKAENAEHKRMEREKQKWQKGEALKYIIAEIDVKLVEGSVGGRLILGFSEKGIKYRVASNPIEGSIVWTITLPEDMAQISPLGPKIPYVLLVYEAEDFCNLVANEKLFENVSRVRDQYPSYTVCYLTNKLMSYVKKREGVEYKNPGSHSGWKRPPIDEVLANLTTHYIGVHYRHCVDEAEVTEHVVGLTINLAYCKFRKKLTRLSVNADGVLLSMNAADKNLIKKSSWLKALVAIPKVQPRYAVAVWKKYPSMKSLLMVYMDPNKSIHEKESLLKDLKVEGLIGADIRLGEVCSKRIYRVLTSPSGSIKTDDVENGAAFFTLD